MPGPYGAMYIDYFGLKEEPFSIVPNPYYCYMSAGHREALAHLLYGIRSKGGFIRLTGEVGTGKTTICRVLLELTPKNFDIAFVLHPPSTVEDLLATICDEFGIDYCSGTTSIRVFVARIHAYLLDVHARGRNAVLIVEEAQSLSTEVLEHIRLLTNLETNREKLLHIIIVGQPELSDKLRQRELRQIAQRITARYHLGPLAKREISEYVNFRLTTAGLKRDQGIFPQRTLKKLHRLSGGVPRVINVICDRALHSTRAQGKYHVDPKTLKRAAREVLDDGYPTRRRPKMYQRIAASLLLVLSATCGAAYYYMQRAAPIEGTPVSAVIGGQRATADPAGAEETVSERPVNRSNSGTKEAACQALFRAWQIEYEPGHGQTVCEHAARQGLRCLEGRDGSIAKLRETNRPVLLGLKDEKGLQYFATLTALQGETATCSIGNELRILSVRRIVQQWSGEYLLLWRVPMDYKERLRLGKRGAIISWLDRELALTQGRPARIGKEEVYDQTIEKQVKEFQRSKGLKPDGIAGAATIAKLTAAVGTGEPELSLPSPDPRR